MICLLVMLCSISLFFIVIEIRPPRCIPFFFFLMIRRPPRSTLDRSSAASDVYKRQMFSLLAILGLMKRRLHHSWVITHSMRDVRAARLKICMSTTVYGFSTARQPEEVRVLFCFMKGHSGTGCRRSTATPVSYTHLTLPQSDLV